MSLFKDLVTAPLAEAGITINGPHPYDIQVHDERVYQRVLLEGVVGFGDSYVDGWWDCDDLAGLIKRLIETDVDKDRAGLSGTLLALSQKFTNPQTQSKAAQAIKYHYDIGNDVYARMLDKRLVYTCGYWLRATTLDQAQEDKLELICRKIGLKPGQRVLDVGCGWGPFAKYAAEKYGAEVVGVTLSPAQIELGRELCKGLPVTLELMDYRDLPKHYAAHHFDHIVSIGMFEHVGYKNYRTFMETLAPLVKPEGYFLLHTIGGISGGQNAWISKRIFPGGYIPRLDQIVQSAKDLFVIENVENFGPDYDKTLCAWEKNLAQAKSELLANTAYDEQFFRQQRFYLLACAGAFRARGTQLWQIVLSPSGGAEKPWRPSEHLLAS